MSLWKKLLATSTSPNTLSLGTTSNSGKDTTTTATPSYASLSIGTAPTSPATRIVYALVGGLTGSGNARTLSSATIGGVSATIVGQVNSINGGDAAQIALIKAAVPTGTTATVAPTWSGTLNRHGCVVFPIESSDGSGTSDGTPVTDGGRDGVVSSSMNSDAGSVIVGGHLFKNAGTETWSGISVAEEFDLDTGDDLFTSGASAFAVAQVSLTVSGTNTDTTPVQEVGILCAINPA